MGRTLQALAGLMLVGGSLALAGCAPPAVIQVTTTADVVADDGLTSLREAFTLANSDPDGNVIELAAGHTYRLTDCGAGPLAHVTVSALVLLGNGSTLNQTCDVSRTLTSTRSGASLVLDDLHLVGRTNAGTTRVGIAINFRGSLVATDVDVSGFDAGSGGVVIDGIGGPGGELVLDGVDVHDNVGLGIRFRSGAARLSGFSVARNDGDGIRMLEGTTVDARYGSIERNTGWGIRTYDGGGDSSVATTYAYVNGNGAGGVSCTGCRSLQLTGGSAQSNGEAAAPGSGGGVEFVAVQDDPLVTPTVDLVRVDVAANRSRRSGAGLFVGHLGAPAPGAPQPSVRLTAAAFTANGVTEEGLAGGGVAIDAGRVHVDGQTRFAANYAESPTSNGGGLHVAGGRATIEPGATFDSNRAGGDGGGAHLVDAAGSVVRGRFSDNTAGSDGGGVHVAGGSVEIGGEHVDNEAGGRGGGVHLDGGATVTGALVQRNRATEGGGLYATGPGSVVDVQGSTVADNAATGPGGGIATDGILGIGVGRSTITGNTAGSGGGLAVDESSPDALALAAVSFTTIAGNSAATGANLWSAVPFGISASVLAGPAGGGTNCTLAAVDQRPGGASFLSDATCGADPTDVVSADDPQLGPLTGNGGATPTRAPAPTGPLGGLVPSDRCAGLVDQRGVARPVGAACEPGSVEVAES